MVHGNGGFIAMWDEVLELWSDELVDGHGRTIEEEEEGPPTPISVIEAALGLWQLAHKKS